MKLSKRLRAVADFVEPGSILADIGTDHGYLPIAAIEEKRIPSAIACDLNQGPLSAAERAVKEAEMEDVISLRLGDGLAPIKPGEVTNAAIAGMGATTIIHILEGAPEVTDSLSRLILQPMSGAGFMRKWLAENDWFIVAETLVEEDGIIYEVIAAEPGRMPIKPIMCDVGPLLWLGKHPLIKKHIYRLMQSDKAILDNMKKGKNAVESEKYKAIKEHYAELEKMFRCL